jgi:hypothetical protein
VQTADPLQGLLLLWDGHQLAVGVIGLAEWGDAAQIPGAPET